VEALRGRCDRAGGERLTRDWAQTP
jgi:hypothetical protein